MFIFVGNNPKNKMLFIQKPQRIICLTEEGTELLYAAGLQDRLVGISGFTYRPPQARKEKPKICTFLDAKFDEIDQLQPDLIVGYSDLQAPIAKELIERGYPVHIFNHHTLEGIFGYILQFFGLIGEQSIGQKLIDAYQRQLEDLHNRTNQYHKKPNVFFEEWYDPIIAASTWVQELIELLGGEISFPDKKMEKLAKNRILLHEEVVQKNPDILIGSWCGKMFKPEEVKKREEFDRVNAVKNDHLYEIKSELILQPGPAALTEGAKEIFRIIEHFHRSQ
ncbi:cobalamin-binding protein [Weeksella virosa]|nr:cobalamin-binding protein [Weeksella virosa]